MRDLHDDQKAERDLTVNDDLPDLTRRTFLGATLAVGVGAYMPWTFAAPAAQEGSGAFLFVSKVLTGQSELDSEQTKRLYKALAANDPQFSAHVQALLEFIKQHGRSLDQLQSVLAESSPALAEQAKAIMTAWYLGVVGEGEGAQCVTYESALNAATVADVLRPPTYCYGPAGSWAQKPV